MKKVQEPSHAGQDPMLAWMDSHKIALTVRNYLKYNYPGENAEDLMQGAEVMSMVPAELRED